MAPWRLSHLPPQMAFKPFRSIKCNTTVATYTNLISGKEDCTCEKQPPKVCPLRCKQSLDGGYGLNLADNIWQTTIKTETQRVVERGHSSKRGLIIDHPRRNKRSKVNIFGSRSAVKGNGHLREGGNCLGASTNAGFIQTNKTMHCHISAT